MESCILNLWYSQTEKGWEWQIKNEDEKTCVCFQLWSMEVERLTKTGHNQPDAKDDVEDFSHRDKIRIKISKTTAIQYGTRNHDHSALSVRVSLATPTGWLQGPKYIAWPGDTAQCRTFSATLLGTESVSVFMALLYFVILYTQWCDINQWLRGHTQP